MVDGVRRSAAGITVPTRIEGDLVRKLTQNAALMGLIFPCLPKAVR